MINPGIRLIPLLIMTSLFSACGVIGNSWSPFRAKEVLQIRVDLADTNVITVQLNKIKNIDRVSSNGGNMVTAAIADPSLLQADPEKSLLRRELRERFNQTKLFHTGEIRLKIDFADGSDLDKCRIG